MDAEDTNDVEGSVLGVSDHKARKVNEVSVSKGIRSDLSTLVATEPEASRSGSIWVAENVEETTARQEEAAKNQEHSA